MTSTDSAGAQPEPRLRTRPAGLSGFWCLFATQFQGAFSDNLYKFLVTYLVIGMGLSTEERDRLVPLVGALFALPFILFSRAAVTSRIVTANAMSPSERRSRRY
jgi:hypothetical protein